MPEHAGRGILKEFLIATRRDANFYPPRTASKVIGSP